MPKGNVDINQFYSKKAYSVQYLGLSFWERIRFGLAILLNKKITFVAKRVIITKDGK